METYIGLILSGLLNIISLVLIGRYRVQKKEKDVTEEEIRQMVDAGGNSGTIDENVKGMLNNIFELSNSSAGEIATHRTDIVAVPVDATLEEIKNVTAEEKYSRIVVYDDNIDNIVGVYHVKDMVKYILADVTRVEEGHFHLKEILMKPYFIPFSKKVDELLAEMKVKKVHMAIVIDEYGGTAGLVTMEDILESIVGNICDEYDGEEEQSITKINDSTFTFDGFADIDDVSKALGIQIPDGDYDTIAGFVITLLGYLPSEDDKMVHTVKYDNLVFTVLDVKDRRIGKIKVEKVEVEK